MSDSPAAQRRLALLALALVLLAVAAGTYAAFRGHSASSDKTPAHLSFAPGAFTPTGPTQHLANVPGVLDAAGYVVTVGSFSRTQAANAISLCADVSYVDNGRADDAYDYFLDWTLRLPNGTTATPDPDPYIQSGSIHPGGTVSGNLCFDGGAGPGHYLLTWRPVILGHDDEGFWPLISS